MPSVLQTNSQDESKPSEESLIDAWIDDGWTKLPSPRWQTEEEQTDVAELSEQGFDLLLSSRVEVYRNSETDMYFIIAGFFSPLPILTKGIGGMLKVMKDIEPLLATFHQEHQLGLLSDLHNLLTEFETSPLHAAVKEQKERRGEQTETSRVVKRIIGVSEDSV